MRDFQPHGRITPVDMPVSGFIVTALLAFLLPSPLAQRFHRFRRNFRARMARERTRHARWARLAQKRQAARERAAQAELARSGREFLYRREVAKLRRRWTSFAASRLNAEFEPSGGD